jgi:hypothetical protein
VRGDRGDAGEADPGTLAGELRREQDERAHARDEQNDQDGIAEVRGLRRAGGAVRW